MSDAVPTRYTVRGTWPARNGNSTYLCDTPKQALKVLSDFKSNDYRDIEILSADGVALSEVDLIRQEEHDLETAGGGSILPDTLCAPPLLAMAA